MTMSFDRSLIDRIPLSLCEAHQLIPLRESDGQLWIGFVDPGNKRGIRALYDHLGKGFEIEQISFQEFQEYMRLIPGQHSEERQQKYKRIGQILIDKRLISPEDLEEALRIQQDTGARLGQVLTSNGRINRLALSQALAEQAGLRHINLRAEPADPDIVKRLDPAVAREEGVLPVRIAEDTLIVAITDPTRIEQVEPIIENVFEGQKEYRVASEFDIEWITRRVFHEEYMQQTIWGLFYRSPEESAYRTFMPGQIVTIVLMAAAFAVCLALNWYTTLLILNAFLAVVYLTISIFRFWIAYRGGSVRSEIAVSQEELASLDDADLPIYTILIPVFREKEVLPRLLRSLDQLDYPKSKLDVKLLLEEVDEETMQEAKRLNPPAYIEFITIPDAQPRTKPKACNYGLISARGKYLVIFDAEDRPEKDQLKKVIAVFRKNSENLICVQAKLNYYNRNQNALTRWFTCEYSNWFDMILPGLDRENFPIPLGGTSNHFLTEKLRELGGWDPFNVTEDADLGMRMYKYDYQTVIVDSTTYEEANSKLWNWIRQRTRWIKGYMQTWLVDMRRPLKLIHELGWKGAFGFHMTVGGTPFLFVINPVFWLLTTFSFLLDQTPLVNLFPPLIFLLSSFNLIVGNFVFVYLNVISSFRRGYYELGRYALLSPVYWVLMSLAAWRAVWQLIFKPFYWEKTVHGLYHADGEAETEKEGAAV